MKVVVCLMRGQSVVDETEFPSENLGESAMRNFLRSTYLLESGYEITYVDPDGDEIIVEFDDDYEVAKLTHQQLGQLTLNVKVSNVQWLAQFAEYPQQRSEQIPSLLSSTDKKTEVIASIIHQTTPVTNTQSDPTLPLMEKESDEQKTLLLPTEMRENAQNQQPEYEQNLERNTDKIQAPKIKTQTQSSSEDQQAQLLLPSLNTKQISDQDHLEAPNQQVRSTKQEKDKKSTKSKSKSKKQKKEQKKQRKSSTQQSEKQKDLLTEKQIKKLIKKEVFKMIPQISQQLKKLNQNQQPSSHSYESFNSATCSKCDQTLTVPFYINSSQGIKLCEQCEEQDLSLIPLIKIKDPQLIENLTWGEPLCQCKVIKTEDSVKFYTEVKKLLLDELRQKIDNKIKQAKTEAKNEKAEQKLKKKKEKQSKSLNKDDPIDSGSSSV